MTDAETELLRDTVEMNGHYLREILRLQLELERVRAEIARFRTPDPDDGMQQKKEADDGFRDATHGEVD